MQQTKIITLIVGYGINGFSGDNGLATSASISYVHSFTLDKIFFFVIESEK
jgi:hypothetical protein